VITTLQLEFERFYQIPYSLTVVVVENHVTKPQATDTASLDAEIRDQIGAASVAFLDGEEGGFGEDLKSGATTVRDTVRDGIVTVKGKIAAVTDWVMAPVNAVQEVIQPLVETRQILQTAVSDSLGSIGYFSLGVDGLIPGSPLSDTLRTDEWTRKSYTDLYHYNHIDRRLGRAERALRGLGGQPSGFSNQPAERRSKEVTTTNPNLYQIAATEYGDPTKWTIIANANGVTDPMLSGTRTIIVPEDTAESGGVLYPAGDTSFA
jgi:hypothetical protein